MKKSRLIAAILVIAALLTILSGCSLYDIYRQYRLERDTPPSYSQVGQMDGSGDSKVLFFKQMRR